MQTGQLQHHYWHPSSKCETDAAEIADWADRSRRRELTSRNNPKKSVVVVPVEEGSMRHERSV
jgi:hypothetical protein